MPQPSPSDPEVPDHDRGNANRHVGTKSERKARKAARDKVKSASFGAGLLWIGFVWLLDLGWAAALIGIGTVLVLEQAVRAQFALGIDRFWLGAGALIGVGGLLILAGIDVPIGPLLLIAAGLAIISSIFTSNTSR
ncbi:hypothetical protein [Fodinicurvata sp. EGI_FJ10296]|uniref:hypothetical protein n=1 Tax=Fodinicurvata sp. EGI_FJ10296 TaxID=3231908 RepID=UPI003456035F